MFVLQGKLVSLDLFEEQFACNLMACKGACCVEGDLGAPVKAEEVPILDAIYPEVEPYLTEAGKEAIERRGTSVRRKSGALETPLVNNRECAYAYMENDLVRCGIERAWLEGKIDFQKPISCHLYPVRVSRFEDDGPEALNYERWDICSPGCANGAQQGIPLYRFLKGPLIRAYGQDFYDEMELVYREWKKSQPS